MNKYLRSEVYEKNHKYNRWIKGGFGTPVKYADPCKSLFERFTSLFSPPVSKIIYKNNLRTEAQHIASGQKIITDAPLDNNGKGEAFSPTDLLASSLVSCVMTIIGIAAGRDGIEIISMRADVSKEMGANPRRVAKVCAMIDINLKGASEEDAERLKRIGLACPVARSLSDDFVQDINFNINLG